MTTRWTCGTSAESLVAAFHLAGRHVPRRFTLGIAAPLELRRGNTAPDPQELLLAALNFCLTVGHVAGCTQEGIELESVEIASGGGLDLRGLLGLDPAVPPGYTVRVGGRGTPEQFRRVHEAVRATSPKRWNLARPIALEGSLEPQSRGARAGRRRPPAAGPGRPVPDPRARRRKRGPRPCKANSPGGRRSPARSGSAGASRTCCRRKPP